MNADFLTKKDDVPIGPRPSQPAMAGLERAIIVILAVTLAAGCFVISSRQRSEDGQRPWRSGSLLQPLTQLMSLNFEHPTSRGTEVKWLVQGLGVAAGLIVAAVGWYALTKPRDPETRPPDIRPRRALRDRLRLFFSSATPASAAQMALVLFAGWTFLSACWAHWPTGAVSEAFRQLIPIVWAVMLGRTLKGRGVRLAAMLITAILTLTAVIGVWYYYERNPVQRLKFPIGNPIFLAACLLPALTLPAAWMAGWLEGLIRRRPSCSRDLIGDGQADGGPASGVPLWMAIACAACFALVGWAFALAGSRGPLLGLACGIVAAAYMAASRLWRRVIIALMLVTLAAGGLYARTYLAEEGSRTATARFRTYTWKYAFTRFLVRPVTGTGQGGYQLGAEAMSLADVEKDPAAFQGGTIGHAHNEWLEVLSDLGAAGLALISTALGITFWAAGLALRKLGHRPDRWCLIGLVATLAALIVEEATDLAMRTPVFPLLFYTVIGLIWALSASTDPPAPAPTEPSHSAGVRHLGLFLGIAGTGVIAWVSVADWQGARAEFQIEQRVEKKDWPEALAYAAAAQRMRLGIEDRLRAAAKAVLAAREAAEYEFDQLRESAIRAQQDGGLDPNALRGVASSAARFDDYLNVSISTGNRVLEYAPHYPNIAGQLASLMLMQTQKEQWEKMLGLRQTAGNYVAEARRLLAHEYARDPFDPDLALRLLQVTPSSEPLAGRLDLLRIPLRGGPIHPDLRGVLTELEQEADFGAVMNGWLAQAQAVSRDLRSPWADPYAPETFRLGALVQELHRSSLQVPGSELSAVEQATQAIGLAQQSAKMAENAAALLLPIRARFPSAAAFALADQARYRLWAAPGQPEEALAVQRRALAEWPAYGPGDQRRSLQETLSTYLLAVGREDEARQNLRVVYPEDSPDALAARLSAHLYELNSWFINVPAQVRPARFSDFVARFVELDPRTPVARLMAAQVAFEQRNDAAAIGQLEELRKIRKPAQVVEAVRFLRERFPENDALRFWTGRVFGPRLAQTRPAGEPESQPCSP